VAQITAMHRLVTAGASPQSAAAQVRANGAAGPPQAQGSAAKGGEEGGRRIRGLVRAAKDFDGVRLEDEVSDCLRERGVVESWTTILVPMLRVVGDRWATGALGVESEHLASASVANALARHGAEVGASVTGAAQMVLACAADETHALPLVALQVALLERGLRSHMLGAAVPHTSLAAAVRRTGPSAVFVWSSRRATGDPAAYRSLPTRRRPLHVVLGGPGWDRAAVADDGPRICVVNTLDDAVDALAGFAQ
jgi:methanogenic corrinoid protein MtbC1